MIHRSAQDAGGLWVRRRPLAESRRGFKRRGAGTSLGIADLGRLAGEAGIAEAFNCALGQMVLDRQRRVIHPVHEQVAQRPQEAVVVGGSEQLQPAGPEDVPAGELERLATVRLVPGGRVAPVPDLGSVYAQDPDRLRGASGHVIRIVSPSSTQTVAGSTRILVPTGRVGTVRLVAHRALRGSRSPVFVRRTPRAKTTRRRRVSVLRTSRRIMIKTSSQVVTAFLGEPHPHSARVGDAFSRGWPPELAAEVRSILDETVLDAVVELAASSPDLEHFGAGVRAIPRPRSPGTQLTSPSPTLENWCDYRRDA